MILTRIKEVIEKPTIGQILAIERKLKGARRELFQGAFDVLSEERHVKDDPSIAWRVKNLKNLYRGFQRVIKESPDPYKRPQGVLYIKTALEGAPVDLGLVSVNVVTNTGVAFVVDALQALATIDNLKWHGSGTTNTAENASQTALLAEVGSRASGTAGEGSGANIYRNVGTLSYGGSYNIVEHGLFSASSTGVLFDRSVFTAIPVDTVTSIEFTYEWTLNAGG